MAKKTKDTDVAESMMTKDEMNEKIVVTLGEAVEAWEEGKNDKVLELVDTLMDLATCLQPFAAVPNATKMPVFSGIGDHLDVESDLGKQLVALKEAATAQDLTAFTGAVTSINEQLSALAEGGEEDGNDGDSDDDADDAGEGNEGDGAGDDGADTGGNGDDGGGDAGDAGDGGGSEEPQTKSAVKWGSDLSADLAENKAKSRAAKAARSEQAKLQKAASFEEDNFSWDDVKGGEYQGK